MAHMAAGFLTGPARPEVFSLVQVLQSSNGQVEVVLVERGGRTVMGHLPGLRIW